MIVAFDTETHLIRDGMPAPKLVCVSWCGDDGSHGIATHADVVLEHLERGDTIVGHNAVYDIGVLCAENPALLPRIFQYYERGQIRCTMVRQKLIDLARGWFRFREQNGALIKTKWFLQTLAKLWLGLDLKKTDTYRLRYAELDGTPIDLWPSEAITYAELDAKITLDVWRAQSAHITSSLPGGELPNEVEQNKAALALQLISLWGVRTDPQSVAALTATLTEQRRVAMEKLRECGIIAIRGSKKKPKEVINQAEIRRRVTLDRETGSREILLTKKGKVSTTRAVLAGCKDAGLVTLAAATNTMKVLSTYVPALAKGTAVPICARYDVLKASGRVGCSAPNLQNPPRLGGTRECIIARPNTVFVTVDYDTLELRALAQVCLDLFNKSELAEAFKAGADPHLAFAAALLKIDNAEAVARRRDKDVADMRQFAKVANFGFPGGLGVVKFVDYAKSYGLELDPPFAKRLKDNWFKKWPEMRPYFDYVNRVVGPLGGDMQQLRSGRVRGAVNFKECANGFFQGLAADGAKAALWQVARECYTERSSALYGSRPVIFIHDEIIMESPESVASDAADRLVEVMCSAMATVIPDVPITASAAMMRRWYKGAKEVRDTSGKLQAWEP